MKTPISQALTDVIGAIPYRMAFAGGWIDQPFVSRLNPARSGSMVVVGLEPTSWFMERSGMATGTRHVALRLGRVVFRIRIPPSWCANCNRGNRATREPSGSQDMIGLIYPGVNRLDYDSRTRAGFPGTSKPTGIRRGPLVRRGHLVLPVSPRPEGYSPLGIKNLDPRGRRLGAAGKECFDAIIAWIPRPWGPR